MIGSGHDIEELGLDNLWAEEIDRIFEEEEE